MTNPLVSIIIPSFNRETLISETLDSVINQTYENWECIVVDDGSTDDTINTIERRIKKDFRIKLFSRERSPKGASTCRNIGIENSKGDYIIFLDSDDLLKDDCIAIRVSNFMKYSDYDFLVFNCLGFKSSPGDFNLKWNHLTKSNISPIERFMQGDTPWATLSVIWSREAFNINGGWDEEALCWQDWEIHINSLLLGLKFKTFDNSPDSYFRVDHQFDSIGKIENTKKQLFSRYKIVTKVWKKNEMQIKSLKLEKFFMLWLFRLSIFFLELGEKQKAEEVWNTNYKWKLNRKWYFKLWDSYLKLGYYKRSKINAPLKKMMDYTAYRILKVHFWDTKNSFKKILVEL
ncbi:hypothetical protein GCM10011506_30400 [Marivirga lumbricoides]|uniref:Glycosyltransferase 2-like domain-containing protein n=1 Tax=Marivirga lumbricoides TaxID=1046115 RepID=A0ABQ1MLB9_9BACT|nr:hypothetical protein GCM10011506_30400 [Marivirga lumbricoides]